MTPFDDPGKQAVADFVPAGVRAMFEALRFDPDAGAGDRINLINERLAGISAADLEFADRNQLTLLLSRVSERGFALTDAIRAHVEAALKRNMIRNHRVADAYAEIAQRFDEFGLDYMVLKGFTHAPMLTDDPRLRVQYDLDLYVPSEGRERAREALIALGYEPIESMENLAMDHLPTMIRKTGWKWRGDYFDPDLPVAIEVHFQFWDAATDCIRVEGLDDFWARRIASEHRLDDIDILGYAALHLVRHLLRGNVRPFHVWEIARFLNEQTGAAYDRDFRLAWRNQHSRSLRRMEAVAFLLAKSWFGCRVPDEAAAEIDALAPQVRRWFEIYAWSPIEAQFRANKHELWLHLALLDSADDGWSVMRRKLLPASMPGAVAEIHTPEEDLTIAQKIKRSIANASYAISRGFYHARTLIPTLVEGVRWWFRARA